MSAEDRQLARRLTREARVADKVAARAARLHLRAVARRERRLRRARRLLPCELLLSAGFGTAGILTSDHGLLIPALVFAVLAGRSLTRLVRPPDVPSRPALAAPQVPPPPPVTSAAFPAVRRLEAARAGLTRLLPLVAPAGRDAAEDAWRCAVDNDRVLRWQAARLAAVEPYRGAEPDVLQLLLAGVAAQERLVAGLADLVSASADPHAVLRLQDATDALHGLAAGLREVR